MAEQRLTQQQKKLQKEEQRQLKEIQNELENKRARNRQINFFIIRYLWGAIRGRGGLTVHEAFGMSRERFTNAIDTGWIRVSTNDLMEFIAETGIRAEIFRGDRCFKINGVTEEQWEKLFEARTKRAEAHEISETEYKKANREYKELEKPILKQIDGCDRNDILGDVDFFSLCYYIKESKRYPINVDTDRMKELLKVFGELTFEELNSYGMVTLEEMQKKLETTLHRVTTILDYRKMKSEK